MAANATTPKPNASSTQTAADETTERIRDFNERVIDAGKKAGGAYLDAYEKAAQSIVDYQEQVARQTDVEWVSTIVDAQAKFTRELTKVYVSTGRQLLK
jgi:2-phosphoglycerate kinase